MEFKIINTETGEDKIYSHKTIAQFLFTHLEQYGDNIEDILKCIDYAMNPAKGGNIIVGLEIKYHLLFISKRNSIFSVEEIFILLTLPKALLLEKILL